MDTFQKEELDIISYLSNPIVRSNVRNIARLLNPSSQFCRDLKTYYLSLDTGYFPEDGSMTAYLNAKKFTTAEIEYAIAKKCMYAVVSKNGANELIKAFYDYYIGVKIIDAIDIFQKCKLEDYQSAKKDLLERIIQINTVGGTIFDMVNLAEANLKEIIDREIGGELSLLPSRFEVVRKSSAYQKYARGWIIEVVSPPGVGKTLFMMNEVTNMAKNGFKIVWVALGDMKYSDFIIRISAIVTGATLNQVTLEPLRYVTKEVLDILANLRVIIYPAGVITANEVVNNILGIDQIDFGYQVVVIDYDDNLAEEYDNMYKEGGNTYRELTRLSTKKDDYKLVFVASQVKTEYWETEILPERCVAQSSAKQAMIDMQICINRNPSKPIIGTINIPKQRRGTLEIARYKLEDNGCFRIITPVEYETLKSGKS